MYFFIKKWVFLKNRMLNPFSSCQYSLFSSTKAPNQGILSSLEEQSSGTEHSVVYSDQHAFLPIFIHFAFKISSPYYSLVDLQEI